MHAYTFFSTVILCHLSEEGIQIILTLHSEDILKIFFLMYILRCSYSVIEGDLIIRKPSNLASGLKITAQHTILHDSKPVSLRTSHADRIPSYNCSEKFPTMHTNIQMKENKLLSL